ncbi:MAG: hypothetical protein MUO50_14085 [Longimicrobiales bacterium]|nr:hypothetical protein [Longimicrobiales bacterium]
MLEPRVESVPERVDRPQVRVVAWEPQGVVGVPPPWPPDLRRRVPGKTRSSPRVESGGRRSPVAVAVAVERGPPEVVE